MIETLRGMGDRGRVRASTRNNPVLSAFRLHEPACHLPRKGPTQHRCCCEDARTQRGRHGASLHEVGLLHGRVDWGERKCGMRSGSSGSGHRMAAAHVTRCPRSRGTVWVVFHAQDFSNACPRVRMPTSRRLLRGSARFRGLIWVAPCVTCGGDSRYGRWERKIMSLVRKWKSGRRW
jgi:hypothetical protein